MVLASVRAGAERGIGWTYAAAAAQSVIANVLAGVVVGRSALDIPGAAEAMVRVVRNIGRPGVAATAISAVDIALWDLKARLLGCSLARLLGQARDRVPVYGSGGFTSYDDGQTREQLTGWVEKDHIPRVKIKIGESWGARRTGTSSGWRWPVRSSARTPNSTWMPAAATAGQAVRIADRLAQYGVTWFESRCRRRTGRARRGAAASPARRGRGEYSWSLADSRGSSPPTRWTACNWTSPAAAASPSSCAGRPWRQRTPPGLRALRTQPARTSASPCPTCGTSSTFTTTSGSSGCSSTAPCTRTAGLAPDPDQPGLGLAASDAERYRHR